MKVTFFGAAGEVTGSQHLIETETFRLLLDCGLFQGHRAEARSKNETFFCNPADLDGVILSHGHIDHCGNLPGLTRHGFRESIFCTEATADVAGTMLQDSARIQQEDACYLEQHRGPDAPPIEPLYDEDDVQQTAELLQPLSYDDWHDLSPDLSLRFSQAGHILGSAICEMQIEDEGRRCRLVFTGDLGRRGSPLLPDPALVPGCDVLISESTYGNRIHASAEQIEQDLLRIIDRTLQRRGRIIIPAFSLGRTQQVIYLLSRLYGDGQLPAIPVWIDSPLSMRLTDIYRRYQDAFNPEVQQAFAGRRSPFDFERLHFVSSRQESMALNDRPGPLIVIAAGGMCENGRIRHHLVRAIDDEANTIVIIGYQARHTLGRRIAERHPQVRIFNRSVPLKARVEVLDGLSAHADAEDFKWWFEHLACEGGIGQAFLVHGEPEAAESLASLVDPFCDEPPIIPERGQSFDV